METVLTERLEIIPLPEQALSALVETYRLSAPPLSAAYAEMLLDCRQHPTQALWYTAWEFRRKSDAAAVGFAGFKGPGGGRPEIGYGVEADFENLGYATEGVAGLCRWALGRDGVSAIEAETGETNAASQRVLEKVGFVPTHLRGAESPRFVLKKP